MVYEGGSPGGSGNSLQIESENQKYICTIQQCHVVGVQVVLFSDCAESKREHMESRMKCPQETLGLQIFFIIGLVLES